jgi:hypothetical protein
MTSEAIKYLGPVTILHWLSRPWKEQFAAGCAPKVWYCDKEVSINAW